MPDDTTAESIFLAALALYEESGAEGVNMRRLAARLNVSPLVVCRHFPDRNQLLRCVARERSRCAPVRSQDTAAQAQLWSELEH